MSELAAIFLSAQVPIVIFVFSLSLISTAILNRSKGLPFWNTLWKFFWSQMAFLFFLRFLRRTNFKKLKFSANHPLSKQNVKHMFEIDHSYKFTEVGGIAGMALDGSLVFYDCSVNDSSLHDGLLSVLSSPKEAYEFLTANSEKIVKSICMHEWVDKKDIRSLINSLVSMLDIIIFFRDLFPKDISDRLMVDFVDKGISTLAGFVQRYSKARCNANDEVGDYTLICLMESNLFLGIFHVHQLDVEDPSVQGPSRRDKIASKGCRGLLLEETVDGFVLWDLYDIPEDAPNSDIPHIEVKF